MVNPNPAQPPPDPLLTEHTFRAFVARVAPLAGRWLKRMRVDEKDREDVLQEILVQTHTRRDKFSPVEGRWEGWAYGFAVRCVMNYRRVSRRLNEHVTLAARELPETIDNAPSVEERIDERMLALLLDECLDDLPGDLPAILLARDRDDIPMQTIADAHGISLSTAYEHYNRARSLLQKALDRRLTAKRSAGLPVLPISLAQLIGSEPNMSADAMGRVWRMLDHILQDGASGGPGESAERGAGPRTSGTRPIGPRTLRAILGPRGLPALTYAVGAVSGAAVTYQVVRHDANGANDAALAARTLGANPPAALVLASAPTPSVQQPARLEPSSEAASATSAPDVRAEARAADRSSGRQGASAPAGQEMDDARDQTLYETGTSAYQAGLWEDAIKALRKHAHDYPRSAFAGPRERLLTLALIRADRQAEARQRIEAIRRANPKSPVLAEYDALLPPKPQQ
jgi:RNA polymerase sigma factor (sigma-70 family)